MPLTAYWYYSQHLVIHARIVIGHNYYNLNKNGFVAKHTIREDLQVWLLEQ